MSRKGNIEKLIAKHNRHLQKLKEQKASFGLHTPAHILTEIEDTETEIEKLQKEYQLLEGSPETEFIPNSPRSILFWLSITLLSVTIVSVCCVIVYFVIGNSREDSLANATGTLVPQEPSTQQIVENITPTAKTSILEPPQTSLATITHTTLPTLPPTATVTPTFTPVLPQNGLIAFYPFNGNANDESKNGNGGVVYGATLTTDRFGNKNSAYYFDGINDYIVSSSKSSLSKNYTVSLWFNPLRQAHAAKVFLLGKTDGCYYEPVLAFSVQNMLETRVSGCDRKGLIGSVNLSTNTWYHVIVVVKGAFQEFYIDKNLIAVNNKKPQSISMKFFIGTTSSDGENPYPEFFNGTIDDIRLYNRALTEEEIQLLYYADGWGN